MTTWLDGGHDLTAARRRERPATPSPVGPIDDRLVSAVCRAVSATDDAIDAAVRAHVARLAPLADGAAAERLVRAAVARLEGLGTLDALLADPTIDEVLVNAGGTVWIERAGAVVRSGSVNAAELDVIVERILSPLGRRVDRTSPIVDARLADGTRVCVVIPPVSIGGTTLTLRRFRPETLPLSAFADDAVAELVADLVARRCNAIVSGATSSGKTSLLASVLALADPAERLVIIEDTAELAPPLPNVVRLEARPATADGVSAVTLAALLRTALRLRPDRIVVGEVRGAEVIDLLQALNTGHDGSLATLHANSAQDAIHRLETLVVQAAPAWPLRAVRQQLGRSVDVVVHTERGRDGRRQIAAIGEVIATDPDDDRSPTIRPLVLDGGVVDVPLRRRAVEGP